MLSWIKSEEIKILRKKIFENYQKIQNLKKDFVSFKDEVLQILKNYEIQVSYFQESLKSQLPGKNLEKNKKRRERKKVRKKF